MSKEHVSGINAFRLMFCMFPDETTNILEMRNRAYRFGNKRAFQLHYLLCVFWRSTMHNRNAQQHCHGAKTNLPTSSLTPCSWQSLDGNLMPSQGNVSWWLWLRLRLRFRVKVRFRNQYLMVVIATTNSSSMRPRRHRIGSSHGYFIECWNETVCLQLLQNQILRISFSHHFCIVEGSRKPAQPAVAHSSWKK